MKKKLFILITILIVGGIVLSACGSGGGNSQSSFRGTVFYNESDKEIYGAEIYLDNEQEPRDVTDESGEFYISELDKSYYSLRVEKDGFEIYNRQINLNEENNFAIYLIPLNDNTIISGKININNSTGYESESLSAAANNYKTLAMADSKKNKKSYVEGEILVKYSDSYQVNSLSNSGQLTGLSVEKEMNIGRGKLVKYKSISDKTVEETVEYFSKQPGVEYAEPNYIVHAQAKPDDTLYSIVNQWNLISVNMEAGWDVQQVSPTVVLAVLDTGIVDHPDLEDYTVGADFVGGNNDGDPSGYVGDDDPTDETPYDANHFGSHGTHVSGIIGALTNNNIGVASLNWDATDIDLIPVRVLDTNQSGSHYDIAEGIYYAIDQNADILNLSLGGENSSNTLQNAIKEAASQNIIIVAASGNSGGNSVLYPAAYEEAIAVGAVDKNNELTSYSNYGLELDLVAPGGDNNGILSTWGYYDNGATVSDYVYMSGTSMAAAHVSGAASLLLQSGVSPANVRDRLTSTSVDLGSEGKDSLYGYGLVDVYGALINQRLDRPYIFISEDNIIRNITQSSVISKFVQMNRDNNYTLSDEVVGDYYVVVWRDVNSNNSIDAGDYYGVTETRTDFDLKNYYTINVDMFYVTESNVSSGSLSY